MKRKKLVYFSIENISSNGAGVEGKIYRQMSEFEKDGYDVSFIHYSIPREGINKFKSNIPFLNNDFNNDFFSKVGDADFLYIRYFLADFNLVYLIRKIKSLNPRLKIISEIPTYPYDFEFSSKSPSLILDKINREKLCSNFDKIVTFSNDKEIYGVSALNISNGVDVEKIQIRHPKNITDVINLIAVARIDFWHGYDRLINGLKNYYNSGGKENINIHIIGNGNENVINELISLTQKNDLGDKVIFYGKKTGKELDEIYNKCLLGVDTLARHRTKIDYNSTLKGKEYLAKGLPIVSGVETELDSIESFKYYLRVPADDSPVDFNEIVKFYHDIYDNNDIKTLSEEIREFCINNFSFDITFKKIIEVLKEL